MLIFIKFILSFFINIFLKVCVLFAIKEVFFIKVFHLLELFTIDKELAREVERTYQQAVSLAGKKDGTTVEFNGVKVILQKEYQGNIGKSLNSDGVCTDSMSELDCKILFNVCDPVMCPPSRFNFGGKWDMGAQVGSVVQKGIVGSLVLGWGNGDILPICLTGIHAGLENIHSMFGGFRDCLEVAKTSGDSVGICNEIRSLYMCNILWEETLALVTTPSFPFKLKS